MRPTNENVKIKHSMIIVYNKPIPIEILLLSLIFYLLFEKKRRNNSSI